ncbi:MAG: hypothetical protein ACI9U2_003612 [Bradymonadia bacterium]|jgi:hypothetical protein
MGRGHDIANRICNSIPGLGSITKRDPDPERKLMDFIASRVLREVPNLIPDALLQALIGLQR